jgi:hypothetical protein
VKREPFGASREGRYDMGRTAQIQTFLLLAVVLATGDGAYARSGYALQFDGADDFVVMGDVLMLSESNITVELWMRTQQTSDGCLVAKHDNYVVNGYLMIVNHRRPDKALFYASEGNAFSTSSVNTGEWIHLAGVYDTTGTSTIYVNGVPEDTSAAPTSLPPNNFPFRIGAFSELGAGAYFDGVIDEVRVWSVARSAQEIRANMYAQVDPAAEPDLAGYWRFDEGTGDIAHDLSGNGYDGQLGALEGPDPADPVWVPSDVPTSVPEQGPASSLRLSFSLGQNCPNPFNPSTMISFDIPAAQVNVYLRRVELKVYDARGRLITCLLDEALPPGHHTIQWDGTDSRGNVLPSGVYAYRLSWRDQPITRKMVILR